MTRRREEKRSHAPSAKSDGKGPKAKTSELSEEDHALWEYMKQGLQPLRKGKPRVPHASAELPVPDPTQSHGSARNTVLHHRSTEPDARFRSHALRPEPRIVSPSAKAPPPLQRFEKKRLRRIASGQMQIEARLDLHGSRQSEAHQKLRAFLLRSVSKGYSTVLVVTGKGAPPASQTNNFSDPFGREQRGVLRRMVPLWLEEPELSAIVASYTTAAIQHGGEGAIYIHLRRKLAVGR